MEIKNFYDKNTMITEFNLNVASGDIQITPNLPIGTKLLYRKINATQGIINLIAQGSEKITKATFSSLQLNSEGDFWLLQKVSDTRWEILEGRESGSNSNGSYFKQADGACTQMVKPRGFGGNGVAYITGLYAYELTKTLPKNFFDINFGGVITQAIDSASQLCLQMIIVPLTTSTYKIVVFTKTANVSIIYDDLTLIGRWY